MTTHDAIPVPGRPAWCWDVVPQDERDVEIAALKVALLMAQQQIAMMADAKAKEIQSGK